jgi:hypothetical protein
MVWRWPMCSGPDAKARSTYASHKRRGSQEVVIASELSGDSGRPRTNPQIRDLIRRMSAANPFWGAPRIHGELLKLGIEVSQATVGRYLPWRPKEPSPTWRSFLHNHLADTVAIDMFIVATATFRVLYTLIVLDHDRRLCPAHNYAESVTPR